MTAAASSTRRDPALDLLRAVALVRVVAWHTFAATWMTWFAALPIMFFVTGNLLGPGRAASSNAQLTARRTLRLLVPLWAYGLVVAGAGAVRAVGAGEPLNVSTAALATAATWIVPLVDP